MNHDELVNVLKIINTASVNGKSKDDATATVLRLAAESFTKDILRSLMEAKNIEDTTTEYLESVSGKIQNVFCGI